MTHGRKYTQQNANQHSGNQHNNNQQNDNHQNDNEYNDNAQNDDQQNDSKILLKQHNKITPITMAIIIINLVIMALSRILIIRIIL